MKFVLGLTLAFIGFSGLAFCLMLLLKSFSHAFLETDGESWRG